MTKIGKASYLILVLVVTIFAAGPETARADAVTEWNLKANEVVTAAKLPTPVANRIMAMVQTTVYEAVNAITKRYPADRIELRAVERTSIEAAIASANRMQSDGAMAPRR